MTTLTSVSAAGSSGTTAAATETSRTALDAQLTRLKKQLSDCENCASAKTREGKAEIRTLQDRISKIEAQMTEAARAASGSPSAAAKSTNDAGRAQVASSGAPAAPKSAASLTVGNAIDTYA